MFTHIIGKFKIHCAIMLLCSFVLAPAYAQSPAENACNGPKMTIQTDRTCRTGQTFSTFNSQFSITGNPHRYSRYYRDPETGFYYCKARYYSPVAGIFTSRDTYDLPDRYSYCGGNPVMHTDPNGHMHGHMFGEISSEIKMPELSLEIYIWGCDGVVRPKEQLIETTMWRPLMNSHLEQAKLINAMAPQSRFSWRDSRVLAMAFNSPLKKLSESSIERPEIYYKKQYYEDIPYRYKRAGINVERVISPIDLGISDKPYPLETDVCVKAAKLAGIYPSTIKTIYLVNDNFMDMIRGYNPCLPDSPTQQGIDLVVVDFNPKLFVSASSSRICSYGVEGVDTEDRTVLAAIFPASSKEEFRRPENTGRDYWIYGRLDREGRFVSGL